MSFMQLLEGPRCLRHCLLRMAELEGMIKRRHGKGWDWGRLRSVM